MSVRSAVPIGLRARIHSIWDRVTWSRRGYSVPAPTSAKWAVLDRYGITEGTWVESGTYLGLTTEHIARGANRVYTIEPSAYLAQRAQSRLEHLKNVEVLYGTSEEIFPELLAHLSGDLSFWLDGHASGGITFEGSQATPIREELAAITNNQSRWGRLAVMIDDFRGFGESRSTRGPYPPKASLVDWSEDSGLRWTVEHDIFVAWR